MIDEKLHDLYEDIVARNPAEGEFHQAVREVFDSLGPVVAKHPHYTDLSLIHI